MICPMPNTHDPNPTAVPIKEAIKEIFRVFMAHPRLLNTTKAPVSFHPDSAILPPTRACRSLLKHPHIAHNPVLSANA
jgi:hypothetical protein